MRRLAREATIFALLGFLTATVSFFVIAERASRFNAGVVAAKAVHAVPAEELPSSSLPPGLVAIDGTVAVPLTDGTLLHVRWCTTEPIDLTAGFVPVPPPGYKFDATQNTEQDCRYLSFTRTPDYKKYGLAPVSIRLGDPDQVTIEKDYWAAYKNSKRQSLVENGMASLILGLWGFPGGIGIWAFYRLVRFAIKG
jgi:hypothetical protein